MCAVNSIVLHSGQLVFYSVPNAVLSDFPKGCDVLSVRADTVPGTVLDIYAGQAHDMWRAVGSTGGPEYSRLCVVNNPLSKEGISGLPGGYGVTDSSCTASPAGW